MSHTYVTLAVPKTLWDIVRAALLEAGYEHAIHDDDVIDMHGLALVAGKNDPFNDAREALKEWVGLQGQDKCWYYPDIFNRLCALLGTPNNSPFDLPSRAEFQQGCCKYQNELYAGSFYKSVVNISLWKHHKNIESQISFDGSGRIIESQVTCITDKECYEAEQFIGRKVDRQIVWAIASLRKGIF